MTSAFWLAVAVLLGFALGWACRLMLSTSQRRMRLLGKRLARRLHKVRDLTRLVDRIEMRQAIEALLGERRN